MSLFTDRNIVIALVLLQVAVCLPFINSFPIALDEPFSIFWAQQELGDLFTLFENENNPPLHFVVLHYWIDLFGISEISVRSLSLIFSILTIPVLFKLSRKFLSPGFATTVVLLFIASRFNHFHALEARVYSLFVLLFVLVVFDLYRFIFEDKRPFIRLALWNVLLLYAHYLGGFIILIEIIILILFNKKLTQKNILFLFGSFTISLLLYLPGISLFLQRFGTFSDKGTWVPDAQYSELYGNIIRFFNNTFTFFAIVGLVIIFIIIFRKQVWERLKTIFFEPKFLFVFLFFILTYFGMFSFSKMVQPVFLDRYLLYTTVLLFISTLIIIAGIIPSDKQWWSLVVIIPMAISTKWIPENNRCPDKEAVFVSEIATENTIIAICPPFYDLTFAYHYNRDLFSDYKNFNQNKILKGIQTIYSYEDLHIDSANFARNIIFIDANSQFTYPGNNIKSKLESEYKLLTSKVFDGGITIYKFECKWKSIL